MSSQDYDVCIVGAGLIGLSVARSLTTTQAGIGILILEKEARAATHQSGHNSGVIHSGLYYKPGSLKARLCVEGRRRVYAECESAGIPVRRSGKLVIATEPTEIPALEELHHRGLANGLQGLRRIGPEEIVEIEPAATGLAALHVPEAGVVDFAALAEHHVTVLQEAGAAIRMGAEVSAIEHRVDRVSVMAGEESYRARVLINCAGLHSDRVAALAGVETGIRIVPFRGEYYRLGDNASDLVRSLIYPVPDRRFPFLGVHFTRKIDGTVEVGPNAVLAVGREHYRGARPDWSELGGVLAHRGFRRLALRHWRYGLAEMLNSKSTTLYARLARRLLPDLRRQDLLPGGAGVRAQAVDPQGNLIDDFVIERAGDSIHVLNAPSPGATASLAIGEHIAALAEPVLRH